MKEWKKAVETKEEAASNPLKKSSSKDDGDERFIDFTKGREPLDIRETDRPDLDTRHREGRRAALQVREKNKMKKIIHIQLHIASCCK
jgi:hypothetical protein